jgi:hypothetical protein
LELPATKGNVGEKLPFSNRFLSFLSFFLQADSHYAGTENGWLDGLDATKFPVGFV